MSKFLNKKEQVFDIKLTSYGKDQLAAGSLKPTYYAFFDDNIVYDGSYIGVTENQNEIHNRIKNNTQYIEGQVLFQDVETLPSPQDVEIEGVFGDEDYSVKFFSDSTPTKNIPRKDIYRFDQMIGDAFLEGNTQNIPAWKVVTLQGQISSSSQKFVKEISGSSTQQPMSIQVEIPQVNVDLTYRLKVKNNYETSLMEEQNFLNDNSPVDVQIFGDDKYISLENDDLMIYMEELNTILLTENFEVQVYEVTGSNSMELIKKDFHKNFRSLNGGLITDEYVELLSSIKPVQVTTNDVNYYFDILKDSSVDQAQACKGEQVFNKSSYYIDLDFECDAEINPANNYFDIYGPVTEPEICQ
mgnify:CR=1 FL=1